jgi:hypothetical protein
MALCVVLSSVIESIGMKDVGMSGTGDKGIVMGWVRV